MCEEGKELSKLASVVILCEEDDLFISIFARMDVCLHIKSILMHPLVCTDPFAYLLYMCVCVCVCKCM